MTGLEPQRGPSVSTPIHAVPTPIHHAVPTPIHHAVPTPVHTLPIDRPIGVEN